MCATNPGQNLIAMAARKTRQRKKDISDFKGDGQLGEVGWVIHGPTIQDLRVQPVVVFEKANNLHLSTVLKGCGQLSASHACAIDQNPGARSLFDPADVLIPKPDPGQQARRAHKQ